jgi:hypothetical protein
MVGAALAVDTGGDGAVDSMVDPATASLTSSLIPSGSSLEAAMLYWGGSQTQSGGECTSVADSTVALTVPSSAPTDIEADVCRCSNAGSASYDVHMCSADVTSVLDSVAYGDYSVGGYSGKIEDGPSDNASFSLVLMYSNPSEPRRTLVLADGLEQYVSSTGTVSLGGFDVAETPAGTLTYHVLEGDASSGSGTEQVVVTGQPAGAQVTLSDTDNPASDPMNETINVTSPAQTGTVGIDLDRFPIDAALGAGDTSIDVELSAGTDKWWLSHVLLEVSASSATRIAQRGEWTGRFGAAVFGAALAEDTGGDGNVDTPVDPATATVTGSEIPANSQLEAAWLYWGGSQAQAGAECTSVPDSSITLTPPSGSPDVVTAEECLCSDASVDTYDVHVCRAEVTQLIGTPLQGSYSVGGYSGLIGDGAADNASFALVVVHRNASLPIRTTTVLDGLQQFQNSADTVEVTGFTVPAVACGSLVYYVLEGDPGGSGSEFVKVTGMPGGLAVTLSDADNPAGNPMNGTINVTPPVQTGTVGIDLDGFAVTGALSAGDTEVEIEFSAGTDKWWLPLIVFSTANSVRRLDARVLLEGAYAGPDSMATSATFASALPVDQPYSGAEFDGTTREIDSAATLLVNPDTVIDWVVVSLRAGEGPETEIEGSRRAAVLLQDGSVRDVYGDTLSFAGLVLDSAHVVIRHRNHLGVMSAGRVDFTAGVGSWDFTIGLGQAFTSGGDPQTSLGNGDFGLFAGDGSLDTQITVTDFNLWLVDAKEVAGGYRLADFDMDGLVTATDFNLWLVNTKAVANSKVP